MRSYPKPILFYHGGCPDGFGAAYAFWKKYQSFIDYYPVYHKREPFKGIPPEVFKNRQIWMADIALEREDVLKVCYLAEEFKIIDHHVSSQKALKDLDCCYFNLDHSGAILAWHHCFPEMNPPLILRYVEDRDLWKFKMPHAREVLAVIDSQEKTFEAWDQLAERIEMPVEYAKIVEEGKAIVKNNQMLIDLIKEGVYYGEIKGYRVPMINTPFFRSEILNDFAVDALFAAAYHYDGKNFVFSLRSKEHGLDVSEIALRFPGGGGHRNAAGFNVEKLEDLN